ncbi:hypothetical protein LINPERPRIM_LOCUS36527 [Linum perenne]
MEVSPLASSRGVTYVSDVLYPLSSLLYAMRGLVLLLITLSVPICGS